MFGVSSRSRGPCHGEGDEAESAGGSGGAVCRYVGHFACVRFGMLGKSIEYLERSRQALIELAFDHYDERLAEAIAAIPGD